MKKGIILLLTILFMVIGFSAYNETVNIYGLGKLEENISDFKVYLDNLKVNDADSEGINDAKDEFTLSNINGNISIDIVNDSTEYDTESYLECESNVTPEKTEWAFDYTGGEQTFTAPVSGTYKLETWGAQGESYSSNYFGGYGGYSSGKMTLEGGKILYINVGSQGVSHTGGYNGGGNVNDVDYGKAGGGATHIADLSGLLSTFETKKENILIVSGGGGGAANRGSGYGDGNGGSAGGIKGNNGESVNHTNGFGYGYGTGGTQNSGGSLVWIKGTSDNSRTYPGTFGNGYGSTTIGYVAAGGGGGFYGGGGSIHGGAGGGSGYIGNSQLSEKSMYCYNCAESDEEATKTISTTCTSSTATENCAKQGNGYARITLVSSNSKEITSTEVVTIEAQDKKSITLENINMENFTCKLKVNKISRTEKAYKSPTEWVFDYIGSEQTFTASVSGTYKLETWGAQGGYAQTSEALGGYGGYSKGVVTLNKNDILYIIVGGKGTDGDDYSTVKIYDGGYNGGGNAKSDGGTVWGAGGGATSIQNLLIKDGQLKNYSNNIENVLIVSGGGGGAGWHYKKYLTTPQSPYNPHSGGSGGGYLGSNGITEKDSLATGGSQSKYGTNGSTALTISNGGFGYGGNYEKTQCASGGGSGLYGGGGAYYNGSSAAGGSGYIGNSLLTEKSMYCYNCATSTEESTKTISTTCISETPTENCAKSGNGYARITLIK